MILAIDIGNTTVALGGIRDGRVCFVARMDTVRTRTAAEYRAEMDKVFAHRRHPERPVRFEGAVLTSVVPQITGALAECARYYTGKKPVIVSPEIRTGLTMAVDEPHAVGKDRLVDAAYAAANFPLPVVTGGLAKYVTPLCRHPLTYDPELLLKGLALLYQMNAPQPHYAAGGRRRNPNNNFRRGRRPRSQRRERREEKNKNG